MNLLSSIINTCPTWDVASILQKYMGDTIFNVVPSGNTEKEGQFYLFGYGESSTDLSLSSILKDPEAAKAYLVTKAKQEERDRATLNESLESTSMVTTLINKEEEDNQTLAELVSNSKTEENVSAIFENSFTKFTDFYNSAARRALDVETRGFLMGIKETPFKSLWDDIS